MIRILLVLIMLAATAGAVVAYGDPGQLARAGSRVSYLLRKRSQPLEREVQIVRELHGQEFALMLRHSLRGGARDHGAARFTWAFPLAGNLRGYTELFKGYGESLIDYNLDATYFGVGVSVLDWY